MLDQVLSRVLARSGSLEPLWRTRGGWIGEHLPTRVPHATGKATIERIARETDARGLQRLDAAYGERDGARRPDQVRSSADLGDLYCWLVSQRRPDVVVEFGAAFGVSGMYFAAGLELAGSGHLYSFEINAEWAAIAEQNIRSISDRVTLTRGAFEETVDTVVAVPIGIAFVDGIHSYDFVVRQFELLRPRMTRGGLLLFDDIDFPKPGARMREAWDLIASHPSVVGAVELQGHVGLVELA